LAGCGDSASDSTGAPSTDAGNEAAQTVDATDAGVGELADANGDPGAIPEPSDETSRDAEAGAIGFSDAVADVDAGANPPGDSAAEATAPGALDPSADVRTLSDGALAQFCDWVNETLGGYGRVANCGGNTVQVDIDQAACVRAGFHLRCAVSVAQYQTCVLAQVPSMGCNLPYESCHPLVCQ
jgi:hypothetical protein